jgi:hypothetical protein
VWVFGEIYRTNKIMDKTKIFSELGFNFKIPLPVEIYKKTQPNEPGSLCRTVFITTLDLLRKKG